jgi:Xaa-Pro aminopeptidase
MTVRAERVAAKVTERELDLLVVTDLVNVRWLTGYTGTSGLAVVGPGTRGFVTDFRYVEQAAEQVPDFDRLIAERDLLERVPELVGEARPLRVGFDDATLPVRRHRKLGEILDGVELVPAGGLVEELRAVKDADEVELIRSAAALADEAFRVAVLERGLASRTEREVAFDLEQEMRRRGAQDPSFPSIIAGGAHGALPHAVPRDVEIPRGTLVVVDWGAQLEGYCSDCTRTLATGPLEDEMSTAYAVVLNAQVAGLEAVKAGPLGREVDAAARAVIDEAGYGERFGHGLGHGVGMAVHEDPRLSKAGDAPLVAGNVVTVEPGVYLPDRFGIRIEDLVVVRDQDAEVLSGVDKGLTTVG